MRTMSKIFFLSVICLFSCQMGRAVLNPELTKKYTNAQLLEMVESYQMSHSKEAMPPYVLQEKFVKAFPKAYDVEWESANNIYEVDFEIRYTDYKAYFDEQGELLMYSMDIRASKLPAIVKNAAVIKYPKYRIEDVDKIYIGDEVLYKVELELSDFEVKALYKSDGTFVKELKTGL